MKVLFLNGPNLNLLGVRQPEIYGHVSFDSILNAIRRKYPEVTIEYYQSNHEGALIDKLHEVGFSYDGIIFNPGAFAHTSIALADAVQAIATPVLEVHVSNIFAREIYREKSYIAPYCLGLIAGLGMTGYEVALQFFVGLSKTER